MRDFLSGVLILGGLAAAGFAVWLVVERRRGKPRRTGAPRARVLLIAGFIALVLGGAIAPAERSTDGEDARAIVEEASETSPTTATTETTPEEDPAQVFARAEGAVDEDDYADAVTLVTVLGVAEKTRIERKISRRLAARAMSALKGGDRRQAASLLGRAKTYPPTPQARRARTSLQAAQQRASARRAERRRKRALARTQERERRAAERERRAAQREAEEDAAAAAEPDTGSVPAGTCDEVGATDFSVPPGDPRDRDDDGVACESS